MEKRRLRFLVLHPFFIYYFLQVSLSLSLSHFMLIESFAARPTARRLSFYECGNGILFVAVVVVMRRYIIIFWHGEFNVSLTLPSTLKWFGLLHFCDDFDLYDKMSI